MCGRTKLVLALLSAFGLIFGAAGVAQAAGIITGPPGPLGATKPGSFAYDPTRDKGPTGYLIFSNQSNQLTCSIPVKSWQTVSATVNFTADPYGCRNDDATRLRIVNLGPQGPGDNNPVPLFLEVCDDSQCRGGAPSTFITVTRFGSYSVPTFQRTPTIAGLNIRATSGRLDGKVSAVRVSRFA